MKETGAGNVTSEKKRSKAMGYFTGGTKLGGSNKKGPGLKIRGNAATGVGPFGGGAGKPASNKAPKKKI